MPLIKFASRHSAPLAGLLCLGLNHRTWLSEPAMLALALLLALGPTVRSSAPKCEVLKSQPSLMAQPFA